MPPKPKRPDLSPLSHTDKDDLIVTLFARMEALEAKLGMNSENLSKPPVVRRVGQKDELVARVVGQEARRAKGAQRNDAPGKRSSRTKVVTHPLPTQCERCHAPLPLHQARVWDRRQGFDVPTVAVRVLMTNLLDAAAFPRAEFGDLYHQRWRIEEAFKRGRNPASAQ